MDRIRQLIQEAHRRSLWQVLSVYLVGSWGALQVVEGVTENAGLPDWVPPLALVLLVIGLPIVLATAVVQEGVSAGSDAAPGDRAPAHREEAPGPGSPGAGDPNELLADGDEAPSSMGVPHRLLTWRNAMAGGAAAFALLGIAVVAYFIMWSTGMGLFRMSG